MEGIPRTADMHPAILEIIADGRRHEIKEVTDSVADRMGVGDEARRIATGSGRLSFDVGVRRAVSNLRIAGLLENEELGVFSITAAGSDIAARRPPSIDARYLRENCEPYRLHERERKRSREGILRGGEAGGPHKRYGIVAIMDVLGVKGSWRRDGEDGGTPGLHKNWGGLLGSARGVLKGDAALGRGATFSAFSDTMFITASGRDYASLLLSFSRAMWPVVARSIMKDVPLRGCVSCGSYFRSKSLFTGSAVDEAAEYYSLPQWIGISAAPSANSVLSRELPRLPYRSGRMYKRHDIPLRASVEQDAWALNWPRQCEDEDEDEAAMEKIVAHIDERMEGLTDVGAALKWRNTRKFCSAVLLDDSHGRTA